jgi:acylphosphatase
LIAVTSLARRVCIERVPLRGVRMPRIRRRVVFSGRVQGVGFRYTCQSVARGFEIGGYVRNLPDGRVEVLAEGQPDEIDNFLSAIQFEMNSYIRDATTESEPAGDVPLTRFSIRF